jgi:cytochrome c nitrite reductase small subunit
MPAAPAKPRHRRLVAAAGVVLGAALGLGVYTFGYARGHSYLTNDPAACLNCHVMRDQFAAWERSSHHAVATCNDCHTPEGLLPKYAVKASNGFWHSFAFTTGRYADPIRIKPGNRAVAEAACLKCHAAMVDAILDPPHAAPGQGCLHCHGSVGHPR